MVFAELRKPEVRAALARLAYWNTRSVVDAEDLVDASLLRTLDPEDDPWVPEERTFLTHMMLVMRQVWWLERLGREREIPDDPAVLGKGLPSPDPPPDDQLERRRSLALYQELADRMRAELATEDPLATRVYDLHVRGTHDLAAVAADVPCKVEEVYEAMRRIRYRAKALLAQWENSEEERMKRLREPATKGAKKGWLTP
jgi:DNA-directed RNA polymerase specialized sigma24 family protein